MRLRILVVDDSKMTRRIISGLVASRWTVCGEAKDGRSGVSEFRKLKPDMVLLDLAMPDIDGIDAINPTVPLILFTLMDPWGLQSAARTAGISRVVSKSEGWELIKAIEEIVAKREVSSNKSGGSRHAGRVHQQSKPANQSR
jgi:two-component system chemotaxis response regulator CheY